MKRALTSHHRQRKRNSSDLHGRRRRYHHILKRQFQASDWGIDIFGDSSRSETTGTENVLQVIYAAAEVQDRLSPDRAQLAADGRSRLNSGVLYADPSLREVTS